jgi:hypothetical protein
LSVVETNALPRHEVKDGLRLYNLSYNHADNERIEIELKATADLHHRPSTSVIRNYSQWPTITVLQSAMYVADLTMVVEPAISTTKKGFGYGKHRIKLCLFLQLAGLTANRSQAILYLIYRHIRVSLLQDPQGSPHRIVIEFTFEFTKGFLGTENE